MALFSGQPFTVCLGTNSRIEGVPSLSSMCYGSLTFFLAFQKSKCPAMAGHFCWIGDPLNKADAVSDADLLRIDR